MSKVWYTSDLHLGHRRVAGIRGFWDEDNVIETEDGPECLPDTQSHDEWLAHQWDRAVGPKDTVFVLGDVAVSGFPYALEWIGHRPGKKHLIAGNHDPVHPMRTDALRLMPKWLEVFESVQPFGRRKLLGRTVLMSHFPYESWGDGPERGGSEASRHNQYRLPDHGELLLHGHTHGTEHMHGNQFHVGVDAWAGQPVPQEAILFWMENTALKRDVA